MHSWCLPRTLERRVVAHITSPCHPSLWPSDLIFLPSWVLSLFPLSLFRTHIMRSKTHLRYYWFWDSLYYKIFLVLSLAKRMDSKIKYYTHIHTHTHTHTSYIAKVSIYYGHSVKYNDPFLPRLLPVYINN